MDYEYECPVCKHTPGCHLALIVGADRFRDHMAAIHGSRNISPGYLEACLYNWEGRNPYDWYRYRHLKRPEVNA